MSWKKYCELSKFFKDLVLRRYRCMKLQKLISAEFIYISVQVYSAATLKIVYIMIGNKQTICRVRSRL
jgi:hypothetical protein